jgi:hypothetical protein
MIQIQHTSKTPETIERYNCNMGGERAWHGAPWPGSALGRGGRGSRPRSSQLMGLSVGTHNTQPKRTWYTYARPFEPLDTGDHATRVLRFLSFEIDCSTSAILREAASRRPPAGWAHPLDHRPSTPARRHGGTTLLWPVWGTAVRTDVIYCSST